MHEFYRRVTLTAMLLASLSVPTPSFADGSSVTPTGVSEPPASVAIPLWWTSAAALVWWVKPAHLPPTLTTFAPGSPSAITGAGGELGVSGTKVLSPDHIGNNVLPGGRFALGHWINGDQVWGIEGDGFFLTDGGGSFSSSSNGSPPLRVPFYNVPPGAGFPVGSSSFVLADPAFAAGSQTITSKFHFWDVEANGLYHYGAVRRSVDVSFLGGFRFLDLDEGLTITSNETLLGGGGGSFTGVDNFTTQNHFFGGQIGIKVDTKADTSFGEFDGSLVAKLALGDNYQTVDIAGSSSSSGFGLPPSASPGGIFTQATNIGQRTRNALAAVPELQLQAGYKLASGLRPFIAYNFIYLSSAVRPGDQIDTTLNLTGNTTITPGSTLTGPARPQPLLHSAGFWAQGIDIGVSYAF